MGLSHIKYYVYPSVVLRKKDINDTYTEYTEMDIHIEQLELRHQN